MNKERFLDVNGFSTEYDVPLEKRLIKYRKNPRRDSSRASVSLAERLDEKSRLWRAATRRKQIISAIVALVVFVFVVALSCYLTFWVV